MPSTGSVERFCWLCESSASLLSPVARGSRPCASAAIACSTGASPLRLDVNRAAPTRTSFTSMPSVAASAWLTRRMHEPQCMSSICRRKFRHSALVVTPVFIR